MKRETEQELIQAARQAARHAYARYSGFAVGAALLTVDGVYVGCNVENASYGLTICAERVALFNAVADGQRDFALLAVSSPGGLPPCGACRQVLAEFCQNLPILLVDADDGRVTARTTLDELLPDRFSL